MQPTSTKQHVVQKARLAPTAWFRANPFNSTLQDTNARVGVLICFSPEAKPEGKNRAHHVDPEQHRAAWVCVCDQLAGRRRRPVGKPMSID